MSRPPPINSKVYHGEAFLGEADVFPTKAQGFQFPNNEIRISHLSPPTERCPPLSVLHTISPFSVPCKIQAKTLVRESPIYRLYYSCYNEGKTAIVVFSDRELHLVAMPSKTEKHPCFWCCFVQPGLYNSCLGMLNIRCLSIVFNLGETLIVANTIKSFEDRIEVLSGRIEVEKDRVRISGMSAELKRYVEDRDLLKQYIETDTVMDNGRSIGVQHEEVLPLPRRANLRPVPVACPSRVRVEQTGGQLFVFPLFIFRHLSSHSSSSDVYRSIMESMYLQHLSLPLPNPCISVSSSSPKLNQSNPISLCLSLLDPLTQGLHPMQWCLQDDH